MPGFDIEKFRRICGMLGSDHAGERAAAAALATKMLIAADLTWQHVEVGVADEIAVPVVSRTPTHNGEASSRRTGTFRGLSAQMLIKDCYAQSFMSAALSDWQRTFLLSLHEQAQTWGYETKLTKKQWDYLVTIAQALGVIATRRSA